MKIFENKIYRNIVSSSAILIAAFSIIFMFSPFKEVKAQSYTRPLSYYGASAGSLSNSSNSVPVSAGYVAPSYQYINGAVVPSFSFSGNLYEGGSYAGTSYVGGSYSGASNSNNSGNSLTYAGRSYSGGTYVGASTNSGGTNVGGNYTGGSYTGSSYSGGSYAGGAYSNSASVGSSYSGNSYGGNSFGGNSFGGSSQVAGVAEAFPKCGPYLKSYLGLGKNNDPEEVKKLQTFLNKYEGEKLSVNGVFDNTTFAAVKRFQDKYAKDILKDSWGLSCNTGYVYITTLAKINDIVCNTNTNFSQIALPNPRPVYYCDGHLDPVSNQPLPCTAITASSSGSTDDVVTSTEPKESVISNIAAAVVGAPVTAYKKTTSVWRKLLGQ